jgi:hypothetical protein
VAELKAVTSYAERPVVDDETKPMGAEVLGDGSLGWRLP